MRAETFNYWQEVNRVKRFFYIRYCEKPTEQGLNTFLKWRERADKAHSIFLANLWN